MIITPQSAAAVVGSQIMFTCKSDNNSIARWEFLEPGGGAEAELLFGTGGYVPTQTNTSKNYTVNIRSRGISDLLISNLKLSDAGKYICKEAGTAAVDRAELVVLGNIV